VAAPTELLNALLESLPDEVAVVDRDGRYLRVNRAHAARLGLDDPAQAVGRAVIELGPRSEAEALLEATGRAISGGAPLPVREICIGVAGQDRWLVQNFAPLVDAQGAVFGAVGVSRDVTAAKRTEQQLRDSIAVYESTIEQLPMNVFRKDREGRFVFVNSLLCHTLGRKREEMLGKTDHDFSPKDLADKYRADDVRVMQTGETLVDVEAHNPREGDLVYIQVFKAPVRNAAGEVIGSQGFFVDITHLKRTENKLVRQTGELENALTALRSNQEQLLVAEKMASLGRLTAGIAHEMNTPLAAVRSALAEMESLVDEYASSIDDAQVDPEDHKQIAAEMSKTIRLAAKAAKRAAAFVQGIKSHTRDLSPKERQPFDAVTVVDETLLLLTHALRKRGCDARFEHAEGAIPLLGSPGRLAQIVTNLVNNAIDATCAKPGHTPSKGGHVVVRSRPSPSARVRASG